MSLNFYIVWLPEQECPIYRGPYFWLVIADSEATAVRCIEQHYGWNGLLHVTQKQDVLSAEHYLGTTDNGLVHACEVIDPLKLTKRIDMHVKLAELQKQLKDINDTLLRIEHVPPKHIEYLGGPEFLKMLKEEIQDKMCLDSCDEMTISNK
jgi:hypothetical protein